MEKSLYDRIEGSGREGRIASRAFLTMLASLVLISISACSSPSVETPASQPHTETIVDSEFTVSPSYNGYQYYKITVPSNATNASVDGHFWAKGGDGNDIKVYVMSEDSLVNFQNHHDSTTFFNSNRVTQEAIQASLPSAGSYYVVFDNTFESNAQKTVKATVTLHYTL